MLRPVGDDLPRDQLVAVPIVVSDIEVREVEDLGPGGHRVSFRVVVRDARGVRAPDLSVDARIEGPHRTGRGDRATDRFGAVTFRMEGPPGTYRLRILDVAAGALELDRGASVLGAAADAG